MRFIADLHIHSHYSISTSPQLTPEHLEAWAGIKGIGVVGTGDFTHPGWLEELKEKLEPAEEGLFRLKREWRLEQPDASGPYPPAGPPAIRFLLSAEISNIYRRAERVRKVHNLILVPTFQAAERIGERLSRFANLSSDGRPILGLDSRDLLEIALESSDDSFFVPAHIWTPWFSALGAKSGFDGIAECYGSLSAHIRAVETGLSSDPPMNWLCSFLDPYTLISNSDAHSPEKLGREANLLDTELSYPGIISALSGGSQGAAFLGTVEFFPQEGKYHYDGHRKCGVCWDPLQTLRYRGICPVCGRPVTIGVLNRVAQLADRERVPDPAARPPFHSLIPLKEILSEITGVGAGSKRIASLYARAVRAAGSEFALLLDMPERQIEESANELLAEAIRRMRGGRVRVEPGFDGQFGLVRLFADGETDKLGPQELLFPDPAGACFGPSGRAPLIGFDLDAYRRSAASAGAVAERPPLPRDGAAESGSAGQERQRPPCGAPAGPPAEEPAAEAAILGPLNAEQKRAVTSGPGPVLILAGPGTGKTRTLTARIAYLVKVRRVEPASILAVTFTNKAAGEMRMRLQSQLPEGALQQLQLGTFHRLGLSFLRSESSRLGRTGRFFLIDEEEQLEVIRTLPGLSGRRAASLREEISDLKRAVKTPAEIGDSEKRRAFELYEQSLKENGLFDLDDLICKPVMILGSDHELLDRYRRRFRWILVDEYQDINFAQYRLIRLLAGEGQPNLFVIGDPNQAIYGFRGAEAGFIRRFLGDYPQASLFDLSRSYRCSDTILRASSQVLTEGGSAAALRGLEAGVRIRLLQNPTDRSEAEMIARTIEAMMGGLRFFSMDSSISEGSGAEEIRSLSDFAVLCRIGRQMGVLQEAFGNHSIPYQTVGETPFFRQEPLRSVIDLLRLAVNDNPAPQSAVLKRKLLEGRDLGQLRQSAAGASAVTGKIEAILSCTGLDVPQEQRRALRELSDSFGADTPGFLEHVLLGFPVDGFAPRSEQVALMTLHAAKGLEFPCVFIPGCEQGLLPYSLFAGKPADTEEERRLFYVGMTRAKRYLFLSYASRRRLFGREYRLAPSPFLDPIERALLELQKSKPRGSASSGAAQRQLDLF